MNRLTRSLAFASLAAASALFVPAAHADSDHVDTFVKQCDADKDGMVSKAEMMKQVEKMFDKMDQKKMGKLDKKQVELFLKEFHRMSGG